MGRKKNAGNERKTYKGRASYIDYNGKLQTVARGNIPKKLVSDSNEMRKYERDGQFYHSAVYTTTEEMNKYGWDYTIVKWTEKKINLRMDWKRIYSENGESLPPKNREQWEAYRNASVYIHKKRYEAIPERIALKLAVTFV